MQPTARAAGPASSIARTVPGPPTPSLLTLGPRGAPRAAVVIAHGEALLEENEVTHFVSADIFEPQDVLEHPLVRKYLDFSKPIALLQVGTLHHYTSDNGAELMREYIDAMAPGSFVAISHFLDPETPELSPLARRMEDVFLHSPMGSGMFRTKEQLREFLPGLEVIPPGPGEEPDFTLSDLWWPDGPRLRPLSPVEQCSAAAVGRADGPGLQGSSGPGTWIETRYEAKARREGRVPNYLTFRRK